MTTQITWVIEQMSVVPQLDGKTDVVVTAAWRCIGLDGQYISTIYGSANFTLSQSSSYTPYDQLTESQVLGWCYENGVDKAATETNVDKQVQDQVNNPIVTPPLPWA
jgi:hypothetical protein